MAGNLSCGEAGTAEKLTDRTDVGKGCSVQRGIETMSLKWLISCKPFCKSYQNKHPQSLFSEKSEKLKEKGDFRQAGEKLWGAVTALIKHYAAIKNVFIPHWGRGKIDNFIANNVEEKYKELFRNLLDNAEALHENFYEGDLSEKAFEERWRKTLKLLEEAGKIVFK
jgi:hypothetical protein